MGNVAAIVVAAGLSSRMKGAQKILLPFQGKTLLEHVVANISKAGINEIILVTNPGIHHQIPEMQQVKLVVNPDFKNGLTSSIQHGILACSEETKGFMICLADMPLIDSSIYYQIKESFMVSLVNDSYTISVPFFENQKGNPVIFSSAYRSQLLNHRESEGCKSIIKENFKHVVKVNLNVDSILKDIDTPSDYDSLKT